MLIEITLPVLKRKKYAMIAVGSALVFGGLSYYLTVANVAFKSLFVLMEMDGPYFTGFSLFLSLIISVMFGVYLALFFFRREIIKNESVAKTSALGVGGTIASVIASGCPTCGAPFLAFFGAPLGLLALPFRGLEIKVLSIILLSFSIYLLAQSIERRLSCKI